MFKNNQGTGQSASTEKLFNKRDGFTSGFSSFEVYHKSGGFQCRICKSDYWRGAVGGVCQDCQQRAEHAIRTSSNIRAKVQGENYANK